MDRWQKAVDTVVQGLSGLITYKKDNEPHIRDQISNGIRQALSSDDLVNLLIFATRMLDGGLHPSTLAHLVSLHRTNRYDSRFLERKSGLTTAGAIWAIYNNSTHPEAKKVDADQRGIERAVEELKRLALEKGLIKIKYEVNIN